jgi:hypothetical protein
MSGLSCSMRMAEIKGKMPIRGKPAEMTCSLKALHTRQTGNKKGQERKRGVRGRAVYVTASSPAAKARL